MAKYDYLLARYVHEKCGNKCEICGTKYPSEDYIMPIHILSKGSYPRMRYRVENIAGGCNKCHKLYDEGSSEEQYNIAYKIFVNSGNSELLTDLYKLNDELPQIKHQNVKKYLTEKINEVKK